MCSHLRYGHTVVFFGCLLYSTRASNSYCHSHPSTRPRPGRPTASYHACRPNWCPITNTIFHNLHDYSWILWPPSRTRSSMDSIGLWEEMHSTIERCTPRPWISTPSACPVVHLRVSELSACVRVCVCVVIKTGVCTSPPPKKEKKRISIIQNLFKIHWLFFHILFQPFKPPRKWWS